jgi:hypothetical protein
MCYFFVVITHPCFPSQEGNKVGDVLWGLLYVLLV